MADQTGINAARLEELEDFIFSRPQLQDQGNQASLARAFLESQPVVRKEDLSDPTCHICKDLIDVAENAEVAIKLTCSHIMGFECLKKWLEDNNSCPMCRATLFGPSEEERQVLHAAISEYAALLRQQTYREQSEALSTLMRDANLDNLELSVLRMEIGELMDRLDELHAAPDTEENRAALIRVARRNADITAALERVEARIRERQLWRDGGAR